MGKDDGADVAAFHHHAAAGAQLLLQADHPGANGGKDADPRGGVGDDLVADQAGDVFVVEQDAIFLFAGLQADGGFRGEGFQGCAVVQRNSARRAFRAKARYMAPVSRFSRPKCRARWRAMVLLPAPAGPSMATMIFRVRNRIGKRAFFRTHPRFFVPGFGRAVKP